MNPQAYQQQLARLQQMQMQHQQQRPTEGANQTAQSIGNLAQLAADLRRSVADFKLPA